MFLEINLALLQFLLTLLCDWLKKLASLDNQFVVVVVVVVVVACQINCNSVTYIFLNLVEVLSICSHFSLVHCFFCIFCDIW